MGRPSFSPTQEQREMVAALAEARVAQAEIARRINVTKKTLQKHFAAELGRGKTTGSDGVKTGDRVKTPPPFQATAEQREMVEILAAAEMPKPQIAAKIGVTLEMLEHHFAEELRDGPGKRRADVIEATYRSAKAGNASAQSLWHRITAPGAGATKPARPGFAGKKAEAQSAAATVGGVDSKWGSDLDVPSDTLPN